jgi:enoyl-[acyl-carrier protein] reductase I
MGFLAGKRILIVGLASNRSIAWGIAKAMRREGAELALTYQNDKLKSRVKKMAGELDCDILLPCDVSSDQEIDDVFSALSERWTDGLDCIVHSVAYANKEELSGSFVENTSREGFRIAHEISSYSLTALTRSGLDMLRQRKGNVITLSYLGAIRAVPNYNVMGLAKASLEANVRYMAYSLGPEGIRVNAVSAGPIKTLAASGIDSFRRLLDYSEDNSPLRRNVDIDEVGNAAAFLASDLASGISGMVLYVDGGYHVTAMAEPHNYFDRN